MPKLQYRAALRGSGLAIHAVTYANKQLCGAGITRVGQRTTHPLIYVKRAVTCKTCLKRLEERNIDSATLKQKESL